MQSYLTASTTTSQTNQSAWNSYYEASQSISNSYNTAMQSYNQASDAISAANSIAEHSYSVAMDLYNTAIQQYQNQIKNTDTVLTSSIIQRLKLGAEPNAKINAQLLKPDNSNDKNAYGYEVHDTSNNFLETVLGDGSNGAKKIDQDGFILFHCNETLGKGNVLKVTYSNLQNSSFNGKRITRIEAVYSQLTGPFFMNDGNHNDSKGNPIGYIAIARDPTDGTFTYGIGGFAVNYTYYDETGKQITFPETTDDGGGAWITIGSLNDSQNSTVWNRIEQSQLQSSGKAYSIYGSTIKVYPGGFLHGSVDNDHPGVPDWDHELSNPNAYYGAGLYHVYGDHVQIAYSSTGPAHNNMWATISTIIPDDKTGIKHPIPPTLQPKSTDMPQPGMITPPIDIPTPKEPPKPKTPQPPSKESVTKQIASVSYHSNTLIQSNDENINQKLSLYKNSTMINTLLNPIVSPRHIRMRWLVILLNLTVLQLVIIMQ